MKIGNSDPAPRFNVIARPNDWERSVRDDGASKVSEIGQFYIRYWSAFAELVRNRKGPLRPQSASPQHWMNLSIGRSNFGLAAIASAQRNFVRAEMNLTGPNGIRAFELLVKERESIETEIEEKLHWDQRAGRNQIRISKTYENIVVRNEKDWGRQQQVLAEMLEKLHRAFHHRVMALSLDKVDDDGLIATSANQQYIEE